MYVDVDRYYIHTYVIISMVQTHLPGYLEDYDQLKAKGVEVVACLSANDAFVMAAWGKASGADGKIRMLADPTAAFIKVALHGLYTALSRGQAMY